MMNTRHFDLAVIGGGIVGAWAAYLAATRFRNVRTVLIERSVVGAGATSRSAGVSLPVGRTPWVQNLVARSVILQREILERLSVTPHPTKALWVFEAASAASLQSSLIGFKLAALSADEQTLLGRALPTLTLGPGEIVCTGGMALTFDAAELARALVAYARGSDNVVCWEGLDVVSTITSSEGLRLALSDGTSLFASKAILTVGPWILGSLGTAAARTRRLRIKKVAAFHLDMKPEQDAPAVFFPASDAYLMPMPNRRQWLFSFRSEEWDCEPQSQNVRLTRQDRETAGEVLNRYLPGGIESCRGGRVFCDAYSPTGEPIVNCHPEHPALVVANAGAGAGFRMAPGLAETAMLMATHCAVGSCHSASGRHDLVGGL
jgi:glycine/D-amino acid oxidase-like deaminating enzyme